MNDGILECGTPGQREQSAIVRVVVGMVMSNEDVFQILELEAGSDDLPRYAIAAVDDIKRSLCHHHAYRRGTRRLRAQAFGQSEITLARSSCASAASR
jgi:hypothetical protein